jgi:hypothetical protein
MAPAQDTATTRLPYGHSKTANTLCFWRVRVSTVAASTIGMSVWRLRLRRAKLATQHASFNGCLRWAVGGEEIPCKMSLIRTSSLSEFARREEASMYSKRFHVIVKYFPTSLVRIRFATDPFPPSATRTHRPNALLACIDVLGRTMPPCALWRVSLCWADCIHQW